MTDSNAPPTSRLTSLSDETNPHKRKKPCDTPETSPQTSTDGLASELDAQTDLQGRKYIEVVCGGRTGRLILDKFVKLDGNKGYGKCIEYSSKLVAP